MATRKSVKKAAVRKPAPRVRKASAAKSAPRATDAGVAHKVVLAGLGAAKRAQNEALKVYGAIATETERLTQLTADAAEGLINKANMFVREGQKIQSQAQARAEAKAREVAKEVRALAAKSQKALQQNLNGAFNESAAAARENITRLEHVFEARVARTLNTFGIPSVQNVRELQARMADLQKALNQLNRRGVRA
ncbi:MAG TPA: phasin family protein [Usitatibacteraceae bacterium]|nr:phasin family protein [Usitatibacteraceae bacterium]